MRHHIWSFLPLAAVLLLAGVFLAGPSGLVRIWRQSREVHRLQRQLESIRERIAQRAEVRARIANPDSARRLALLVFGADSALEGDSRNR